MAADLSRFAMLALECVHRQYPNKIAARAYARVLTAAMTGTLECTGIGCWRG